jgi:hypothetical protein
MVMMFCMCQTKGDFPDHQGNIPAFVALVGRKLCQLD